MPLTDDQLLERLNAKRAPTSILFNAKLLAINSNEGTARLQFEVGPEFCNPRGDIQGGIVAALLDESCAYACIAAAKRATFVASLELKTSYLSAAKQGLLFAEARCIKMGRTFAFLEAELTDPNGKLLAKLSTTVAPLSRDPDPKPAEGATA